MIRINLLPLREAQRAVGRRQQISMAVLGVLLAIIVLMVPWYLQQRQIAALEAEAANLQTEITKLEAQAKEVKDLDQKKADLQAKLKIIDELKQKRVGPVRILEDLSTAAPEKLWLTDFTDVGGSATINGMALDNQTIAIFMRQLQTSKYYFDVDLVETSQVTAAASGGIPFKKFTIKARLDYLGNGGKPVAPPPTPATSAKPKQ